MHVEVILLERVPKLGQIGDLVRVKAGFARNYLFPNNKALRATDANKAEFEHRRSEIEAHNLENRSEAEAQLEHITDKQVVLLRQASESGQLYGSASASDIAEALTNDGVAINRGQILLNNRLKTLGIFDVTVALHPEVHTTIKLNVAKSTDEAEQQWQRYQRGEPVLMTAADEEALEEKRAQEAMIARREKQEQQAAEAEASADEGSSPPSEDSVAEEPAAEEPSTPESA